MAGLVLSLRAEALKVRRTRAVWLALGAPLSVVCLYLLLIGADAIDPAKTGWIQTSMAMLGMWTFLMLPLYIALETALINAIDHEARGWTHLFALPVPRAAIHAAKLCLGIVLVGLSSAVLAGSLLGAIAVLQALGVAAGEALPWRHVLGGAARGYGGALGIIAIHHALSLRLRGFEWPLGIGIVAMIFATQISQSSDYWYVFPWSYPTVATSVPDLEARTWALLLSGAVAVVVAVAAAVDTARRDIA
jgi:hypothetical protein